MMDKNTRAVLERLIEALEKMIRPVTGAAVGGTALTRINEIIDALRKALEMVGVV